jgi:hypothetical protein
VTGNRQTRRAERKLTPREQRRVKRQSKKQLTRYLIAGGVALIGILLIVALILPSLPGRQRSSAITGPGTVYPAVSREHVPQATRVPASAYNSTPPTSGPHWPIWSKCGESTTPIANELQIHNLEHGFVVVQYNTQDQAMIEQLRGVVTKLSGWPDYYILAPNPNISSPIALTAWTVLLNLDTVDEAKIKEFSSAYRARGPEPGAPGC